MDDHAARAERFRKMAAALRDHDRALAERHVKQAALVLRAAAGLHILRQQSEESAR